MGRMQEAVSKEAVSQLGRLEHQWACVIETVNKKIDAVSTKLQRVFHAEHKQIDAIIDTYETRPCRTYTLDE
jgi:hypothetical protein